MKIIKPQRLIFAGIPVPYFVGVATHRLAAESSGFVASSAHPRAKVLKELIETEQSFVGFMKHLLEVRQ
jgi:hypothetical protein